MKPLSWFDVPVATGIILISLLLSSCTKGNSPPFAVLKAFPSVGDTSVVFEFDAGGSKDDRSYSLGLQYRWDFDGDGTWDTEYAKYSSIAHPYKQPGNYIVAVEVKDLDGQSAQAKDSIIVFGENLDVDTLYDPRDGNRYRIVRISGQWWMSENLRFGTVIPTDREQTDNDTVEMYRLTNHSQWDTTGGIYLWLETKNYNVRDTKGICPDGWHLPTREEWEGIIKPYPHLYAFKYYGKNGLSNLNLDLNNGGRRIDGLFQDGYIEHGNNCETGFWSSSFTLREQEYLPYFCHFASKDHELWYGFWDSYGLSRYYSVRCVRDN